MKNLLRTIVIVSLSFWASIGTTLYAQINLANGLVADYPFNGNANDVSGNGNNGTFRVATFLGTDRFMNSNASSTFNGSNFISVNTTLGNFGLGDFSVSMWFNSVTIGTNQRLIAKRQAGSWDNFFDIYLRNSRLNWSLSENLTKFIDVQVNKILVSNQWYFYTIARKNGVVYFYLDGKLESTTTTVGYNINNNYNLTLGVFSNNPNSFMEYFNGKLDDVLIYNRALTGCEVMALYNHTFTGLDMPTVGLANNVLLATSSTFPGVSYGWSFNGSTVTGIFTNTFTGTLNPGTYTGIHTYGSCVVSSTPYVVTAQIANINIGLVAHYPFNGNANDESGNGNNGTFFITTSLGSDRFMNANVSASFSGSNYIGVNTTLGNFGLSDFTISTWFNSSNVSGDNRIITKRRDDNLNMTNYFATQVGNGQFATELSRPGGSRIYIYPTLIQPNLWYHVVYQRDGNNLKVYMNNLLINNFSLTSSFNMVNNTDLLIGAARGSAGNIFGTFKGRIDDARIYTRALNQSEITTLYTEYCDTYFAQAPIITNLNNGISVNTYAGASYSWSKNGTVLINQSLSGFSGALTNGLYTVTVTNAACKAIANYQLNQYSVGVIAPQNNCNTQNFLVPIETPTTIGSGIIGMDIEMSFNPAIMTPTGVAFLGNVVTATGVGLVDVSTQGNILHLNISYDGAGEFSGAGVIVAPQFALVQPAIAGTYTVGGGNVKESYQTTERDVTLSASTISIALFFPTITGQAFFWGNGAKPIANNNNPAAGVFVAQSLANCIATGKTSGTNATGSFSVEMGVSGFGISATRDIPATTPVVSHLNAFDNVLITRIVNNQIANPTVFQLIAADVNGSGAITSGDRTLLRRRTLMQITTFPNNVPDWKFYNSATTFVGFNKNIVPAVLTCIPANSILQNGCASVDNITLTGILIGDVDGSYAQTLGGANLRTESVTYTEIDYASANTDANDITSIPVKVYHDAAIEGFDVTLNFDAQKYKVESVTLNETNNINNTEPVGFNVPFAGYLIATVDNDKGLNTNPYLLSINVRKLTSSFVATDLGTPSSYINGKAARTEIVSDVTAISNHQEANTIFKIYPNPTTGSFVIETSLTSQAIEISDVLGKVVYKGILLGTNKTEIQLTTKGIFVVKVGNKVQKLVVE